MKLTPYPFLRLVKILPRVSAGWKNRGLVLCVTSSLAACSFPLSTPVPVMDRHSAIMRPPPGIENAGKPGYYTVLPGDTVYSIARTYVQTVRDIVLWNALSNPNLIEVGQVLRVVPPVAAATSGAIPLPAVGGPPASPLPRTPDPVNSTGAGAQAAAQDIQWGWPAAGKVSRVSDPARGGVSLDISNTQGTPVLAAADGVVAIVTTMRGYGNLVVIKHSDSLLSAYGHNRSISVKENQSVRKGQQIAEMGAEDSDKPKLNFQVRLNGKTVDPERYLPAR